MILTIISRLQKIFWGVWVTTFPKNEILCKKKWRKLNILNFRKSVPKSSFSRQPRFFRGNNLPPKTSMGRVLKIFFQKIDGLKFPRKDTFLWRNITMTLTKIENKIVASGRLVQKGLISTDFSKMCLERTSSPKPSLFKFGTDFQQHEKNNHEELEQSEFVIRKDTFWTFSRK